MVARAVEPGTLAGRVAIVTGGARGIGRAVAELFVREGASVVVNDSGVGPDGTDPDPGLVHEIVEQMGVGSARAVADSGDIGNTDVGVRLVEVALEAYGGLDVVVNAAGIVRDRMIFNMSDDEWDEVIRVHLRGHFSTIRPAAAYWRTRRETQGHFRIINVTSDSGLQGSPGQANYAAAKMGIVGLTYSAAQALARYGVTVNAIAPGALTRLVATIPDDKQLPGLDDSLTPESVAAVIGYVAGVSTDWLSGRVLGVMGQEIRLFSNPQVLSTVTSPKPWSHQGLKDIFEAALRPLADGLPASVFAHQRESVGR